MNYTINNSIRAKWVGGQRSISNIKYIVLHYTANSGTKATAKGNANYFKTTTRKASAHYIVDQKEVIYQAVPDNVIAWSVGDTQKYTNGGAALKNICTNSNSISIEMVSCSNEKGEYYIPTVTLERAAKLVSGLMKKYSIDIAHVVRHYDVTGKLCPAPLVGIDAWARMR